IAAGKVKVLAVAASKRLAALPNVPTVVETHPRIDLQAWQAIAAPKGTPVAIVQRLNQAINDALDSEQGREALMKMGVAGNPLSVRALEALMARDEQRLGDLVRSLGLKAG